MNVPFPFNLNGFRHGDSRLLPMTPEWASRFAEDLARMDPWLRLGYTPLALTRFLSTDPQERLALTVLAGETPAACLAVRPDWLRGPLLELLAVLPEFQGCGLGKGLIAWLADETRRQGKANLWTISSEFNLSARSFYGRQGFEEVGGLPGLISPGETEILLRLDISIMS